ncbi:MAG: FtsW/RodA/SpoVE family cell cycle protein [Chloroflexota bacterium]
MQRFLQPPPTRIQLQSRLLITAAVFLFFYSVVLTLSPAARERTWDTAYRWIHWLGFVSWCFSVGLIHWQVRRKAPESDPYLLPLASLLSGWGLLTIWRLLPDFGLRQAVWMVLCALLFYLGLRRPGLLRALRRYKYVWLVSGLLLMSLTLIFGTNPMGGSQRLWLGCCGFYFQPSEPLKLLLVVYLAAYLADRMPLKLRLFTLLAPTLLLTGIALLLLFVQRDLGTASVFIFIYASSLYFASGRKRVLLACAALILLGGLAGYFAFDVVRLRIDAWLNPWLDPSGRSYQIVQSLLAIANGGVLGRGIGIGNPGLVPVAHSDFIFSSIAEEAGLAGTLGLLLTVGLFTARGMVIAISAANRFQRLLAAGLTTYISAQSILIIGGNLRLLPLTGITLPFVSYGGSSLVVSFVSVLILMQISLTEEEEPAPLPFTQPYRLLPALLGLGLFAAALVNGWWAVVRSPALLTRTDNARRAIADRYVMRGSLLDQHNTPITVTLGESGNYNRAYLYPDLAPITGYTHPSFGQAGLEASLDNYLRGLQGNPTSLIWWNQLLYGTPPPGLDVRLTLNLALQARADELLGYHAGAVVLLNAENGEILAMASHPAYDPNRLDEIGETVAGSPSAPLLNRATQGQYPPGEALSPILDVLNIRTEKEIQALYTSLGLYEAPNLRMPVAAASDPDQTLLVSPLQMALAAATISGDGVRPAVRIAQAVNIRPQGWVILPPNSGPVDAIPPAVAQSISTALNLPDTNFWQCRGQGRRNGSVYSWYLAGTGANWQGTPLAIAVVLEANRPDLAESIGQKLLAAAVE